MTRHMIALAAAAALGIGTLGGTSRAADETNKVPNQNNVTGGSGTMGQTGAHTDSSSSSSPGTASPNSNSSYSSDRSGSNTANSSTSAEHTGNGSANSSSSAGASNSSPNNIGPVGGEFAMEGSDRDLHTAVQSADSPDKLFLVCAAIDNNAEMRLAQLAEQKAQDPQVKQFAQQMVRDHQQAENQLQTACQETGVQMPRGISGIKQQELKVFQTLNGKEFDQKFISCMRAAHAKAVNEYQDVSQMAKDTHVKDFASKALPTLQEHYRMVEQQATALGLPNGAEAQTAGARMPGESSSNSNSNSNSSSGMNRSGSSSNSTGR
jgi:putative membrane protein